jgi:Flp pilus assembly protein TadG
MLEAAIVLPIFILLVIGSIEIGISMMTCNVLATAARHGARTGSVRGSTNSTVQSAVAKALAAASLTGTTTSITVNGSTIDVAAANSGAEVKVSVSIPYSQVSPVASSFVFGANAYFTRSVVMRHE